MPEITSCPDCEKKLRVPDDLLDKKVRCPGCGVMFVAQPGVGLREEPARASARSPAPDSGRGRSDDYRDRAPPPPAYRDGYAERPLPRRRDDYDDDRRGRERDRDDYYDRDRRRRDDDHDDYDRDRRRRDDDQDDRPHWRARDLAKAWRGVRTGINLVIIGGWVGIGMWGVIVIGLGIFMLAGVSLFSSVTSASADRMPGQAVRGMAAIGLGLILFFLVVALIALAEVILRLVGYGMCMQVPSSRDSSAKPLAIAAFACAAAAVFLNVVGAGFNGDYRGGGWAGMMASSYSNAFGLLSGLLAFAGFICWLIFLRCVAMQLRNSEVARRVVIYLIGELVFWTLSRAMLLVIFVVIFASGFSAMGSMLSGSAQGAARSLGAGIIISIILGSLIFLGYLAMEVWHIMVATQVRGVVDRHLARL